MESAEDDAGSTTGASCLSARESNGAGEGATPIAVEGNLDEPSQDVNTDTILEMIDRLVDGSSGSERPAPNIEFSPSANVIEPSKNDKEELETSDMDPVTSCNANSEDNVLLTNKTTHAEPESGQSSASTSEVPSADVIPTSEMCLNPIEDLKSMCIEPVSYGYKEDCNVSSAEIASSSEAETLQKVSHFSECEPSERTVKCVSSSDNTDKLSVDSVEATCSEERDYRPDTTVSSTVDYMCGDSLWTSGTVADSITKHVSSSSNIGDNCDSIEADNLKSSEMVSFCKAETSVSPKRIKLIRKRHSPSPKPVESSSNKHNEEVTPSVINLQKRLSPLPGTSVNSLGTEERENIIEKCVNSICDEQSVESDHYNVIVNKETISVESGSITEVAVKNITLENDIDHKRVEPLKLNLSALSPCKTGSLSPKIMKKDIPAADLAKESKKDETPTKQVPKLTIKLGNRSDECKSPLPKLTIKPPKPPSTSYSNENDIINVQIPSVTKLNIKPIPKPAEKISEIHRKSSSSEISESECSENDDSPSTSDNTASDQSSTNTVPKVTIKMGKPGTETEGQFYTEKTVPKLTIKTLQNEVTESDDAISKVKLKICHNEDHYDKIQKLTIKPVLKPEVERFSSYFEEVSPQPDLTQICDQKGYNQPIPKLKITPEVLPQNSEQIPHVPKLTILLKSEETNKNIKKGLKTESTDSLPIITKLNIKPIPKPEEFSEEMEESTSEKEKDHQITNLSSFKSTYKIKDQLDSHKNEIPVITKVHIKPIKNTEDDSTNDQIDKCIPVVTKLNIKPVVNPVENDSKSETENSSDESSDVPIVTKINIKPIIKPNEIDNATTVKVHSPNSITKLNIKPIIKTDNEANETNMVKVNSPSTITKLNIKPIVKPDIEIEDTTKIRVNSPNTITKLNIKPIVKPKIDIEDNLLVKNVSQNTITKLNIKPIVKPESDTEGSATAKVNSPSIITKLNIKPIIKPDSEIEDDDLVKDTPQCVITKLNIKPVVKPDSEMEDIASVRNILPSSITKLNIKPIVKPDNETEVDTSVKNISQIPITKLNIKPLLEPDSEVEYNEEVKDISQNPITKLVIKPLVKPDKKIDNASFKEILRTHPITKLNIKPIVKPDNEIRDTTDVEVENTEIIKANPPNATKNIIRPLVKSENARDSTEPIKDDSQTIVTKLLEKLDTNDTKGKKPCPLKLTIKPILETENEDTAKIKLHSPNTSAKLEGSSKLNPDNKTDKMSDSTCREVDKEIPNVTKLNIKPIFNPNDVFDAILNNCDKEYAKKPQIIIKTKLKDISDEVDSENVTKSEENTQTSILNMSKVNETKTAIDQCSKGESYASENTDIPNITENIEQYRRNINKRVSEYVCTEKSEMSAEETNYTSSGIIKLVTEEESAIANHDSKLTDDCDKIINKEAHTDIINVTNKPSLEYSSDNAKDCNYKVKVTDDKQNTDVEEKCALLKRLLIKRKSNDLMKKDDSMDDNFVPSASTVINCSVVNEVINVLDESDNTTKESSGNLPHEEEKNIVIKSNLTESCINSSFSYEAASDNHNKTDIGIKNKVIKNAVTNTDLLKPLEILTSEKSLVAETSGQDSPRIILKINKTDHGTSSKLITEETINVVSPKNSLINDDIENIVDEQPKLSRTKPNRRKQTFDKSSDITLGKRLRSSSKIAEEVSPVKDVNKDIIKKSNSNKNNTDVTLLDAKRLKLDGLLTNSLTITKVANKSPKHIDIKNANHSIMNNDNGSKNGSSKLLDILSNFKVLQTPYEESAVITKNTNITYADSITSSNSSDVIEVIQPAQAITEILSNENSCTPIDITCDETIQDPLDIDISKSSEGLKTPLDIDISKSTGDLKSDVSNVVQEQTNTPTPRKRGRPRKLPISEDVKPVLPVPAIEERPQRSLRLYRERPVILTKPRGRRGRGGRGRPSSGEGHMETEDSSESPFKPCDIEEEIDPTSSRIKLPRLTEALDNMPSVCGRPSISTDSREVRRLLNDNVELKVVLEELRVKSPESVDTPRSRGRGALRGRGSRGGAIAKTPRGQRGRRGGGRGAMYMKETMGIYGRVCGPATTTVQLFEEETCMMDDNATPSKPSHLLDDDSQSSVKSETNESCKFKKSKFAHLFDSNKVWTAADVKEYKWPPPGDPDNVPRVMMIQEQVAMFLEVKSFKRKYPELKRRTISAQERDFVLAKGLVTEALCDLGITAVDAGDVLDIMLSDFPHKYEEFRTHQRNRQLMEPEAVPEPAPEVVVKPEETVKLEKPEGKTDSKSGDKTEGKSGDKTEPMSEKMRQELAAAAIASASEFNARLNSLRRPACVDLQSYVIQTRRKPPAPAPRTLPNLYPHALLPGQYQHWYRLPNDPCFSYFPLNTVMSAAPAPPDPPETQTDSEPDWGYLSSDCDSDGDRTVGGKRKKLTKSKKIPDSVKIQPSSPPPPEELCRTCGVKEDRKVNSERFLTCAKCNAKLHPSCLEFGIETTSKCRTYAWHCPTCKSCDTCHRVADEHKMMFCDLCDRGVHCYCAGLERVPQGRWHCVECAVCKSCGSHSPGGQAGSSQADGPAEWHHQNRRGPGGQKQYSHSLCAPCARAFRIGRYCPVCERSFIGPKGTMQLVICKLCDRQHHQECVSRGGSTPNVMEYTCSECRRTGITSRSAAARLAPRTIATLFMAKRRFNKYVHRQYVASRLQEQQEMQARRDNQHNDPDCTE